MCNTETTVQVPSESSNPPGENSPVPEPVLTVPGSDEACQNTPVQSAAPCEEAGQEQEEAGESSLLGELLEENIQSVAATPITHNSSLL